MANQSTVAIEDLFNRERCPKGIKGAAVVIYSPIGLILSLLRIFLGFHAFVVSCLLPRTSLAHYVVLRCLCTLLGFYITEEDCSNKDEKVRVMVANHISPLDHTAVNLIQPCCLPNVWDIPNLLRWCFGYADLGVEDGRDTLIVNAKRFCTESKLRLLAFPEGSMTSGRKGMLKFSSWPFSLDRPVQPLVITIDRPAFADVAPIVLGSRWWLDILWFIFVPYTHFTIRWLPPQTKLDSESPDEFALRTQRLMCDVAGIQPTIHTSRDAVDYAKRVLLEERLAMLDSKMEPMITHVKQVLPQVPIAVIRDDLRRTQSVDTTISNLLEGRVPYTPELVQPSAVRRPVAQVKLKENDPESWKAVYEERKKILIDENRRKYLIRQGFLPA